MAKAVTLKNSNNEEVYPVTDMSLVNGTVGTSKLSNNSITEAKIFNNAISTDKVRDGAITTAKLADDAVGWKYLGQTKLTAVSNLVQFFFPAQYNFYKIIFAGEMASGSNTWVDLRLLTGTSGNVGNLTGDHQTWEVAGTTWGCLATTNVIYQLNTGGCSQYDTINLEFSSFKTTSSQWRKFQGNIYKVGDGYIVRSSNGRLNSSTEPTGLEVITGGTFGAGATIKVWGSNI